MTTKREHIDQMEKSDIADDAIISASHDPVEIFGMDSTGRFIRIAKIDSVKAIRENHKKEIESWSKELEE